MSNLSDEQRQIERADLVRALQALPPDSLVLRAIATIIEDLVEEVSQDLEVPAVVGEEGHKLAGRLGGIRAVRVRMEAWRTVQQDTKQ